MTASRCFVLAVHMLRWDLFWLGPNKVTIFSSLLGLTASALSNLAAVRWPSQELLLPCGTQLHHELVNSQGALWFQSGHFSLLSMMLGLKNRQNRKRTGIRDENYPLCVLTGVVSGSKRWLTQQVLWHKMWVWVSSWGADICFWLLRVAFFTPKLNWSGSRAVRGWLLLFMVCLLLIRCRISTLKRENDDNTMFFS